MSRLEAHLTISRPGFQFSIDFDVPARGIVAAFGQSGAGKTTLLRCIAGLDSDVRGVVKVAGEVWQDTERAIFRAPQQREIGFVFQEPRLFQHLSVRGNLVYGWKRTPLEKRRVEIDPVVQMLDIRPLLERRVGALSLGEQQRVAIGRAILTSPRVLLMDEPLSSLDVLRKREILPFIRRLYDEFKIPIVYVSHALEEILQLADTMVLLDDGKIVAAGETNSVLSRLDLLGYTGDTAGVVLKATVMAHETEYGLTRLGFNHQTLYIPFRDVAIGSTVRVHILARNVSIALSAPESPISILNIFKAEVAEIAPMQVQASSIQVRLDVDGMPLLASITRKSLENLKLQPGQTVYTFIKAVSLAQELLE